MAKSEIRVDQSPLAPGTSKPVHIRLSSGSGEKRKVRFEVTDESDSVVQEKEFELPGDVDQIAWFVEAPNKIEGSTLKLKVSVDDEPSANASLPVE